MCVSPDSVIFPAQFFCKRAKTMIEPKPARTTSGSGTIGVLICALIGGLSGIGPVYGQDDNAVDVVVESGNGEISQARQAAGPLEEVIVTGQRSFGSLIREGAELTEDFYSRLNDVIDQDKFKINCWNEFPTGSRISTRVCRMRYQDDAMNRQATSIIRAVSTNEDGEIIQNGVIYDVQLELSQGMREFETVLLDAVNTDNVLNDQVIRLIALKSAVENYESPREQRRNERRAAGELDE
jgi:hypothetical protein